MIALATALALSFAACTAMIRVLIGPTLHDRSMGAHAFLLCMALWIAALAALDHRADWADVALAVAFGDLVLAFALFKAFRARSLQPALTRPLSGAQQ